MGDSWECMTLAIAQKRLKQKWKIATSLGSRNDEIEIATSLTALAMTKKENKTKTNNNNLKHSQL